MILLALLAAAAATPQSCADQVKADPAKGIEVANGWAMAGGGALARQCLGLAYVAQERYGAAAIAFETGALEAEKAGDTGATGLWVQAANARLADGDAGHARSDIDAALSRGALDGPAKGEAYLDRARASVALKDLKGARADLDQALKLVPQDPLAWLLSATLARRMDDLPRAEADIAQAAKLSPDDASVALEAGNIAMAAGSPDAAKVAWQGAIATQPNSEAARTARAALDALNAKEPKKP